MDNLTHSLTGALLGQMGLKKKTGLAMPTLIIAANIPDIDAYATFFGGVEHLGFRRGITHGPIAMFILPLLLWAVMLAYDKWRPSAKRLPVHKGWLLLLAFIGTISHPMLDWLNNYGIRFFEPFSSRWSYGDTIFIIDIWIWIALVASLWISLRRERQGKGDWNRPAWTGFTAICAYVFANGLITERAERLTAAKVTEQHQLTPELVVANPVPLEFWKREMQWRDEKLHGYGWFSLSDKVDLERKALPHLMDDPRYAKALRNYPEGKAFLLWSRMPVAEISGKGDQKRLNVYDQRFANPLARDRFMVSIPWAGRDENPQ